MQRITPCLWFDGQAEEAAKFYTGTFSNSKIVTVTQYGAAAAQMTGRPPGSVMTVIFQLDGQEFMALNGGPQFTFSPAISFIANCDTQQEIDALCEQLSAGGAMGPCGWLTDKYGLSWQVVPRILGELMQSQDAQKSDKVMQTLLQMQKLDIVALQEAAR